MQLCCYLLYQRKLLQCVGLSITILSDQHCHTTAAVSIFYTIILLPCQQVTSIYSGWKIFIITAHNSYLTTIRVLWQCVIHCFFGPLIKNATYYQPDLVTVLSHFDQINCCALQQAYKQGVLVNKDCILIMTTTTELLFIL